MIFGAKYRKRAISKIEVMKKRKRTALMTGYAFTVMFWGQQIMGRNPAKKRIA